MALSREPKTERWNTTVVAAFLKFLRAMQMPEGDFSREAVQLFMCDYVACGYVPTSNAKRVGELRTHCRRRGMAFPDRASDSYKAIKDMDYSLKKTDPFEKRNKTVVDIYWIHKAMEVMHVTSLRDMETCSPVACATVCRMLVGHACMLRGTEHDLEVRDVVNRSASGCQLVVNRKMEHRKIKLRPPRTCGLVGEVCSVLPDGTTLLPIDKVTAGAALEVYMARFHENSARTDKLFPQFNRHGKVHETYWSATDFGKTMQAHMRSAGMAAEDVAKVQVHGLRYGGNTDWQAAGMAPTEVAAQGGWRSPAMVVLYNAPRLRHHWAAGPVMAGGIAAMSARYRAVAAAHRPFTVATATSSGSRQPAPTVWPRRVAQRIAYTAQMVRREALHGQRS